MPPLQVKDCPAEVYEQLRICAKEENRSISQQALTIIEDFLDARARGLVPGGTTHQTRPREDAFPGRTRPYSIYERDPHDTTDYAQRHRRVIEEIRKLPPIPVTEETPDTATILAQIREEEAR